MLHTTDDSLQWLLQRLGHGLTEERSRKEVGISTILKKSPEIPPKHHYATLQTHRRGTGYPDSVIVLFSEFRWHHRPDPKVEPSSRNCLTVAALGLVALKLSFDNE